LKISSVALTLCAQIDLKKNCMRTGYQFDPRVARRSRPLFQNLKIHASNTEL
jgi:hypothetical protein